MKDENKQTEEWEKAITEQKSSWKEELITHYQPPQDWIEKDEYLTELKAFIQNLLDKQRKEVVEGIIGDIEPTLQMELEEYGWRKKIESQLREKWGNN